MATIKSSEESFYCYIYYDPSRNNEPIYVGKGKGDRAFAHLIRKDRHPFVYRLNKMKANGVCPVIGLYAGLDQELAYFLEQELISKYGRRVLNTGSLFNLTEGGSGNWGRSPTEETKLKISKSLTGKSKTFSEEALARIHASRFGKPLKPEHVIKMANSKRGKKFSEQARVNMSAAAKIRNTNYSEERNRKVSEGLKGHIVSEETRGKTRANHIVKGVSVGANNPMFGKKQSDETREKIRQKQLAHHAKKKEASNGRI